jgi:hypothetical protein
MRDNEDEARIKAYMQAKMKHIKMYNECMNLADGLNVEKFAELVRADEREACAELCEELAVTKRFPSSYEEGFADGADVCANAIRERGEK